MTLRIGTRLIVKNETEILIPKTFREEMMKILHFTHIGEAAMLRQTKWKIFLANMRKDLIMKYDECNICAEHKTDKA